MYRLFSLGLYAIIFPLKIGHDMCLPKWMLTFELVILPTESRLDLRLGAYMTSVRVMCTLSSSQQGSEATLRFMVPRWFTVKDSPLAMLILMGGIECME